MISASDPREPAAAAKTGPFARSRRRGAPAEDHPAVSRREGELAAAAAAVLFGTAWVATGIALRAFTPAAAAFWRGALAALLLGTIVAILARRGRFALRGPVSRRSVGRILLLGLLGGPVFG